VPVDCILLSDKRHGWRKLPNRVRGATTIVEFFKSKFGM
jgi:hypothetical protein